MRVKNIGIIFIGRVYWDLNENRVRMQLIEGKRRKFEEVLWFLVCAWAVVGLKFTSGRRRNLSPNESPKPSSRPSLLRVAHESPQGKEYFLSIPRALIASWNLWLYPKILLRDERNVSTFFFACFTTTLPVKI